MNMSRALLITFVSFGLLLPACKSDKSGDKGKAKQKTEKKQKVKKDKKKKEKKADKAKEQKADFDKEVVLNPKGNQMKFKQTEFTVKPGQKIKLVFDNTATAKAMKHNVIVVGTPEGKGGKKAADRINKKGMKAGKKNEYTPKEDKAMLATTGLTDPGGKASVIFTVPEKPGKYPYICTYPGHYPMMQGDMIVKK